MDKTMKTLADMMQLEDRHSPDNPIHCPKPFTCPLSLVRAGMMVRITELSAPPDVTQRLREIGFGEQQVIRLLIRQSNLICQVCNTRLALSSQLAQMIMVEPLAA
jgi:Fe2+ transport system protein FeoA